MVCASGHMAGWDAHAYQITAGILSPDGRMQVSILPLTGLLFLSPESPLISPS